MADAVTAAVAVVMILVLFGSAGALVGCGGIICLNAGYSRLILHGMTGAVNAVDRNGQ